MKFIYHRSRSRDVRESRTVHGKVGMPSRRQPALRHDYRPIARKTLRRRGQVGSGFWRAPCASLWKSHGARFSRTYCSDRWMLRNRQHRCRTIGSTGVGKLVLVDPDSVEERNLNRILNSGKEDSYLSTLKVHVVARAIAHMGLGQEVLCLASDLATPAAVSAVASADIAFGCMDSAEGLLEPQNRVKYVDRARWLSLEPTE